MLLLWYRVNDVQRSFLIIRFILGLIPFMPPICWSPAGGFALAACDTNSCTTTTQIKINSQILWHLTLNSNPAGILGLVNLTAAAVETAGVLALLSN